jgi:hypothetical protein
VIGYDSSTLDVFGYNSSTLDVRGYGSSTFNLYSRSITYTPKAGSHAVCIDRSGAAPRIITAKPAEIATQASSESGTQWVITLIGEAPKEGEQS